MHRVARIQIKNVTRLEKTGNFYTLLKLHFIASLFSPVAKEWQPKFQPLWWIVWVSVLDCWISDLWWFINLVYSTEQLTFSSHIGSLLLAELCTAQSLTQLHCLYTGWLFKLYWTVYCMYFSLLTFNVTKLSTGQFFT